ncbi:NAD-dependent epimerase/dehydratase family protein [Gammaproteobacteria bacterium]|nr:NAD-dependent epimerase/dehydratase family protein [Gammaproteobacteria bacterium]|tara:strand:- start:10 stop:912 length:903 start_codon:yes stop_codon:yes gene_type:complete
MDKLLLLGGHGFLGSHILSKLIDLNYEIHVVGRNSSEDSQEDYIFHNINLCSISDVQKKLPSNFQYIINVSGSIDHSNYFYGGKAIFESHFLAVKNIIDHIDRSHLKKFIQIGSSDEYGSSQKDTNESLVCEPFSPYSLGKLFASNFISYLGKYEDFPGLTFRPFLFYGNGQKLDRFLPSLISACIANKKFDLSPGEQIRDFCHVKDIVDAILISLDIDLPLGEIINLGSGDGISIKEMVLKVQELVGAGKPSFGSLSYREGENMHLVANTNKAFELLGWKPEISLEDGLVKTIQYYKNE